MSTPVPPADPGPDTGGPRDERSLGEIVGDIAKDLSTLVRQEIELAKTELKQEATKASKGAGMLGGAALAGYLTILFLSLTLMFALRTALGGFVWAALIVAVIWGVVAAVLAATGRKKMREVNPKPEATIETLKEDAQWAKTATRND